MVVLLAIEVLLELTRFGRYSETIPGFLRYTALTLFLAVLWGILSLRYQGYVIALILTGVALVFDARAALIRLRVLLEMPALVLQPKSVLLPLAFHTGIHLFVLLTLLKRSSYFGLPRVSRKEERTSQLKWFAGGVVVLLLCGLFMWGAYQAGSWPFRCAKPDEIEVAIGCSPTEVDDDSGQFHAILYEGMVTNRSSYAAPVAVIEMSWKGPSLRAGKSETLRSLNPGEHGWFSGKVEAEASGGDLERVNLDRYFAWEVKVLRKDEQ